MTQPVPGPMSLTSRPVAEGGTYGYADQAGADTCTATGPSAPRCRRIEEWRRIPGPSPRHQNILVAEPRWLTLDEVLEIQKRQISTHGGTAAPLAFARRSGERGPGPGRHPGQSPATPGTGPRRAPVSVTARYMLARPWSISASQTRSQTASLTGRSERIQ